MPREIHKNFGLTAGIGLIHNASRFRRFSFEDSQQRTHQSSHQLGQRCFAQSLAQKRDGLFPIAQGDHAIFLLTPTGEVASWNPGAQRIKGYKAHEIVGRHFRIFYPPDDIANEKPERELELATATGRFEEEGWRLRKDGSRFWASVIITAVRDHDGRLLGFGKVTRDLTERKNSEEQMRELSGRLLKMQDEERRRMGRELHDTIGQYLSAAKMSLDGLASEERFDDLQTKSVAESLQLIERSIREIRTLSYLLYPPMLEESGLSSAIRWHLEGFSKRSAIQTTYEIPDDAGRLPHDTELALFRVLQESLTNIHRHSASKTAMFGLSSKIRKRSLRSKTWAKEFRRTCWK